MTERREIISLIPSLLSAHECVIIPGLGGFILLRLSAKIHPLNHKFEPPSSKLAFNYHLRLNDGLLAGVLASKFALSHQKALEKVQEFAWWCISELNEGVTLHFDEVGKLWFDAEKNIHFEAYTNQLPTDDSFGLSAFVSPPVKQLGQVSRPKHKNRQTSTFVRKTGQVLKYTFLILPLLFLLVWSTTQTGVLENISAGYFNLRPVLQSVDVLPEHMPQSYSFDSLMFPDQFKAAKNGEISAPIVVQNSDLETYPDLYPIISQEEEETPAVVVSEPKAVEPSIPEMTIKYCIIGGCFAEQTKADEFVAKLLGMGYPSFVQGITSGGLTRIAVQGFGSKEEAEAALSGIKSNVCSDAWIIHR